MALDIICQHCKKKVIESYRIINPYLYGSKIRKCPKCGGEIFDNRWREVAIQGFDPIQDTEVKYSSWFGFGLIATGIMLMRMDTARLKFGNPAMINVGMWFCFVLGGIILIVFLRHVLGFVKRKNNKYMAESIQRLHDREYVEKLRSRGVRIPDEYCETMNK
jgi:hypothetical protein